MAQKAQSFKDMLGTFLWKTQKTVSKHPKGAFRALKTPQKLRYSVFGCNVRNSDLTQYYRTLTSKIRMHVKKSRRSPLLVFFAV